MKQVNSACVVRVGDGRGFIIEQRISTSGLRAKRFGRFRLRPFVERRLVVTAAHCLPKLPPAHAFSYEEERTYRNLLGRLDGERNVWAVCLFVDPIADIAILGSPDSQIFENEPEGYESLVDDSLALPIAKARSGNGWLLALDGSSWIPTKLHLTSGLYGTSLETGPTEAGMSGSPILNDRGRAVGLVAIGHETVRGDGKRVNERSGPQPILTLNLPGWLAATDERV